MKLQYKLRCDISRCGKKATYSIGNPDSSKATHFHICEDCVKSLADSLPDELKPVKIVEKVVEKEVIKEVEKIVEVIKEVEKKAPAKSRSKKTQRGVDIDALSIN